MPASTRMFYFDAILLGGAGKVYLYEPVSDPLHPIEFWHKRFSGDIRGNHIYSRLFSPDGMLLQSITESIDQKGASLIQLALTYPSGDTGVSVSTRITESSTFLFGPPDSTQVARYQIDYREPTPDSVHVILTRERSFVREEQYNYQGKDYPAMRFVVKEVLETETEGFTESAWETTEVYALGLGLVYYRKPINEEFVLEYKLRDIREYDDFFTK
jgi:hypothetical protein